MPELLKESFNLSGNKKATLIKISDTNYVVDRYKLIGPNGDKGLKEPKFEEAPMTYVRNKFEYELQFEAKMIPIGGMTFPSLQEAEKNFQQYLVE